MALGPCIDICYLGFPNGCTKGLGKPTCGQATRKVGPNRKTRRKLDRKIREIDYNSFENL